MITQVTMVKMTMLNLVSSESTTIIALIMNSPLLNNLSASCISFRLCPPLKNMSIC